MFFSETLFLFEALATLKLALEPGMALNFESCLPVPPKCWNERYVPLHPASSIPDFKNKFKVLFGLFIFVYVSKGQCVSGQSAEMTALQGLILAFHLIEAGAPWFLLLGCVL